MVDWPAAGNAVPSPSMLACCLGVPLSICFMGIVWVCRTGKEAAPQAMAVQAIKLMRGGVSMSVRYRYTLH